VLLYQELNANTAKQHHDDEMPLNKAPVKRMIKTPPPEIKTLDDLAKWCAMPKGSYRITLLSVSRDLPTSQTVLITISISVVLTM